MPSYSQSEKGYGKLWDKSQLTEAGRDKARQFVRTAQVNRGKYEAVQKATGCPWYMVAAIHMREFSMRFTGHLHNGEPLTDRTRKLVPKGRPKTGNPPFTWEQSAFDALSVPPHDMRVIKNWSTERILYELEKYNGFGYVGKINSPYVWSGTNQYFAGKFVGDGRYDPNHIDNQLGCVAFLKALGEIDKDVARRLEGTRQDAPPEDVVKEEQKRETKTGKVIVGTGTATGAGSGASSPVVKPILVYAGIGIALAVLTIGIVLWVKGYTGARAKIAERW